MSPFFCLFLFFFSLSRTCVLGDLYSIESCQFSSGAHEGTFDLSSRKKPQRQDVEERTGAGREGAKTGLENFQSAELVTDAARGRQISSLRAPPVFKKGCNRVRTVAG